MMPLKSNRNDSWRRAALYAAPLVFLAVALFYYWFVAADRFVVFLYGHLGATPFDPQTTSRYWMAGLVASGAIMVLYTAVNFIAGLAARSSHRTYKPPSWLRVWLLSALPLAVAIPAVVMRFNQPTLPLQTAVFCTAVMLSGFALALAPGRMAAQSPMQLGWLALVGMGLIPSFLLLRAVELPRKGFGFAPLVYAIAIGSTIAGALWVIAISLFYTRKHNAHWRTTSLFISGLSWSYLALPLIHHLLFTPQQYRYISSASNFFADNPLIQLTTTVTAIIISLTATAVQKTNVKI